MVCGFLDVEMRGDGRIVDGGCYCSMGSQTVFVWNIDLFLAFEMIIQCMKSCVLYLKSYSGVFLPIIPCVYIQEITNIAPFPRSLSWC